MIASLERRLALHPLRARASWLLTLLNIRRLLLISAVLRLLSVCAVRKYKDPQSWEFGIIAKFLISGHGFSYGLVPIPSAFMPSGYPLLLAACLRVFGTGMAPWLFLNLVQAGFGTLLVYLTYQLSLELYGRELLARLAALLVVVYPPFVYMCNEFHSINFYIVLSVGAVLYLNRACRAPYLLGDTVKAALLMGPLLLFRAEALVLLFTYAALLLISKAKPRLLRAAAYIAISLLFLLPWIIRNYTVFHRFIPTTTSLGLNLWIGNNPNSSGSDRGRSQELPAELKAQFETLPPDASNEIIRNHALVKAATAYIRDHPSRELHLAGRKISDLLLFDPLHELGRRPAYWLPSLMLTCLALLHLWTGPRASLWQMAPIVIALALGVSLTLVFFALPRYKIVFDPFLCIFAASTLYGIAPVRQMPHGPVAPPTHSNLRKRAEP